MKSTYSTITLGEIFLLFPELLVAEATMLHVSFKKVLASEKAL